MFHKGPWQLNLMVGPGEHLQMDVNVSVLSGFDTTSRHHTDQRIYALLRRGKSGHGALKMVKYFLETKPEVPVFSSELFSGSRLFTSSESSHSSSAWATHWSRSSSNNWMLDQFLSGLRHCVERQEHALSTLGKSCLLTQQDHPGGQVG